MNKDKKYLTTQQLSKQLGVSVSIIKKYCKYGTLKFKQKSRNTYQLFATRSQNSDRDIIKKIKSMGISPQQIRSKSSTISCMISKSTLERAMMGFNTKKRPPLADPGQF